MSTDAHLVRRCTVYQRGGEPVELTLPYAAEPSYVNRSRAAGRVALRTIMSRTLVCARPDLEATAIVGLMMTHHVGCIPIVDAQRRPIGVITKFDLLEQLDATLRATAAGGVLPADLTAQTADDVMMPIALTLHEAATIAHAAAMMMSEDTHHVLAVSDDGVLVGVVSSKDVVGWLVENGRGDQREGRNQCISRTTRASLPRSGR